jgi:pimeloyl-ACP methyl ester carboxylesterase
MHGLFVNSNHWCRTLAGLRDAGDVRVYAPDLLGSARMENGENGRFLDNDTVSHREEMARWQWGDRDDDGGSSGAGGGGGTGGKTRKRGRTSPTLENVPLGTSLGGHRLAPTLELRHPLGSLYNFYTWAEQLANFTREVIHGDDDAAIAGGGGRDRKMVTLVANSIGTMSSLQSMIDELDLYNGVLVVDPNFRELHSAEVPMRLSERIAGRGAGGEDRRPGGGGTLSPRQEARGGESPYIGVLG